MLYIVPNSKKKVLLLIYLTTVKQSITNEYSCFDKKINKATHGQKCKNTIFLKTRFESKIFSPKKCVNYNNSNWRQNSVKGPKDSNMGEKCQKVT